MKQLKLLVPLFLLTALLLSSCETEERLSYNWGKNSSGISAYENATYEYYKKLSPESLCELLVMYEDIISNPGGSRDVPPPGVCAEFGYLLLKPENVASYEHYATKAQLKAFSREDYAAYGVKLLQMEMEYYPESVQFLKQIIDNVTKQGK